MPDHLDAGPLSASELDKRIALHALTVTGSLRALAAFGAFQEASPAGRAPKRGTLLAW